MSKNLDLVRVACQMDDCYCNKKGPHICLKDGITIVKRTVTGADGRTYTVGVCFTYQPEVEVKKTKEETKTAAAKKEKMVKESKTFRGMLDPDTGLFIFKCADCGKQFSSKIKQQLGALDDSHVYVECTHCGFRISADTIEFKGKGINALGK